MADSGARGDRWLVEVDRAVCIGSGLCVSSAPEDFTLDAVGRKSHPVADETDATEAVLAAAEGCPVEAISIRLRKNGEVVFPPEE
ncbi:ferredoxin [Streptomyces sp. H27-D2]|uniref:ferredoxin n=1 Tax=Streptomyces sp. H27-D2 TaxID=3046304 RepID=UPI002DBE8BA6|nr:ferredoxin [Streptomyces sp. H27-D2]MEC4017763.1 ferredoxin [Streptomyces sp. H27-D2]